MRKKNLKSLALNKKSISNISITGGTFRTAGCYSVQICPVEPDTEHTLAPIPVQNTNYSVCVCHTDILC
jgi:hypothetical protein